MTQEGREQYARSFEILSGAHGLTGEALEDYLSDECEEDSALRERVLELLAACDDDRAVDGDVLADASLEAARRGRDQALAAGEVRWRPDRIGQYEVLGHLGSGGTGVVFEAQQISPRRRVALKLLNPMYATGDTLLRFRREAELLGRLQHPGIAQIFEVSTFDAGHGMQPFFAMELVDGLPITEYADKEGFGVAERLAMIAQLCDVVQYAHEAGVIHRDLKPANILAARSVSTGGSGDTRGGGGLAGVQLKVLDFGIARVVDPGMTARDIHTSTGQIVGTVSYMSPEQASGDPDAIDVRTDVYTLGVVAYELLSHSLPHGANGAMVHDVLRAIREDDPVDLGTLNAGLRGDVETIVAKALEREPNRRYASAAEMAADIRRNLDDRPILARQPSSLYQLRKFARRNRVMVAGLASTLIVAVVGAIVAVSFAVDSRKRADELQRVAEFYSQQWSMNELGAMAAELRRTTTELALRARVRVEGTPQMTIDHSELERLLTATDFAAVTRQFLDDTIFTTARIALDEQFEDLPLVQASLLESLSQTMFQLDLTDQAAVLQERALAAHQEQLGSQHRTTLRSMALLGRIRFDKEDGGEDAAQLLRAALEGQRRILPSGARELRDSLSWLSRCAATHEESLEIKRELFQLAVDEWGAGDAHTLHLESDILHMEGDREGSVTLRMKSVQAFARDRGQHDLATLTARGNLAVELRALGRLGEAEESARAMLVGSRAELGEPHRMTSNAMCILGGILCDQGQFDEAESHLREAIELRERFHTDSEWTTQTARMELDRLLRARRQ